MEESKRQDHPEDGSRRFAKAIKIVWERPGNSPSFGEISAIYEQRSNDLEGQIKKSNDYGEAMLWHRMMDAYLTDAIKSRFVANTKTAAGHLFKHPGGLSSFSARMYLGRCMGLYGATTYADLKIINDIRNSFAHPRNDMSGQLELWGFDYSEVVTECAKLEFVKQCRITKGLDWPDSARERFRLTTHYIGFGLWVQYLIPGGWSDGKHPPWPDLLP